MSASPSAARFLPQETIARKRDGEVLSDAKIEAFIAGVTDGRVSEGQVAAFAMAVIFNKMNLDERVALTRAMTRSGRVLDWSAENLPGPVLDKHSTGGIGDKVSLILGPAIAACGGFNPMISGRGLGHTGGTLDKFDAIPGYATQPDLATFRRVVREAGTAIIGATDDIAPADRRIYAIRDVTATVESLDLITASILSKKLAAGLDALVMDVKFGSGAFARRPEDAVDLARSIVTVGTGAGMPTIALMTDMNQCLGTTAGNALEVAEAVAMLAGEPGDPRLYQVTRALVAEALVLGGIAGSQEEAGARFDAAIASGAAAERFGRMVAGLGGPAGFVEDPWAHLRRAPVTLPVLAPEAGIVQAIDARAYGLAVIDLGGGRTRPEDRIDHAVGLAECAGIGDRVGPSDRPLAVVHAADEAAAGRAAARIRAAVSLGEETPADRPLIARRLAAHS